MSALLINTVVSFESVAYIRMYLPFNVDFVTLTVTNHHSVEVGWRVGFCMYVYVKKFK